MAEDFVIEMLHITKEFPGIKANDDITLQLRKGEVHALLGENGAGKSTLMSVLFGLYQPEQGKILKNGKEVAIRNPNDANALGIGMVHQHFKLVECFSVLDNIILGVEPNKLGFLQKAEARRKVMALSEKYGLRVDPDAFDNALLIYHLQELKAGRAIDCPVYDYTNHNRSNEVQHIEPAPVLIVEGILPFVEPELCALFDYKIFVDTDADERILRRILRDVKERGRSLDSVIDQYLTTVKPMHEAFVEPSKRNADIIVPNGGENSTAVEMLAHHIRTLIERANRG